MLSLSQPSTATRATELSPASILGLVGLALAILIFLCICWRRNWKLPRFDVVLETLAVGELFVWGLASLIYAFTGWLLQITDIRPLIGFAGFASLWGAAYTIIRLLKGKV